MQQAFPCPKCGTPVPVGHRFCRTCGQQFEYRCRHCGAAVKSLSGFCTNCGGQLHQQTQPPTEPAAKEVVGTRREEKSRQVTAMPQSVGHVGRYLILVATIIFMGAILYIIGTGSQGETSNWFGGSFIFGGQSPPSTPPNTDIQEEPQPDSDLPKYTADQVISEAKKISPHCRLSTRQTG